MATTVTDSFRRKPEPGRPRALLFDRLRGAVGTPATPGML